MSMQRDFQLTVWSCTMSKSSHFDVEKEEEKKTQEPSGSFIN